MSAALLFERDGAVAHLTIDRPEAANRIGPALTKTLVEVAGECDSNPHIRGGSKALFRSNG